MPVFGCISGDEGGEGIGHQISTGGTKQLCNSTGSGREEGQACGTFCQIKRESGKAPPAAEGESNQNYREGLQCKRNRRKPQWYGDVSADRYEQAGGNDNDAVCQQRMNS